MSSDVEEELREILQNRERFEELVRAFIDHACNEEPDEDEEFNEYYKVALTTLVEENVEYVFSLSGSPIETIFLNSLVLGFIKADSLGLIVHPVQSDAEEEIKEFLSYYEKFRDFLSWYENKYGSFSGISEYLDGEVEKGKMSKEERGYLSRMVLRYLMLPLQNSFHMSLQPKFPNIKIDGKSIRPDMLFWIPEQPDLKVIVECDGFDYHSDKEKFSADRKRDRALQTKGYRVLRYSGSEIYSNPAGVTADLAQHLWALQNDCEIQP